MSTQLRDRLAALPKPKVGDKVKVYDLRDDMIALVAQVTGLSEDGCFVRVVSIQLYDGRDEISSADKGAFYVPVGCCEVER